MPFTTPQQQQTPDSTLIERSEAAISKGLVLRDWCRANRASQAVFPLNLKKKFQLENRAEGYFGEMQLDGETVSVMGCRQEVHLTRLDEPNAPQLLQDLVFGKFLSCAHWQTPDGVPGGFSVERSLYQGCDGEYGKFDDSEKAGCIDWRDLGAPNSARKYRWVLLTIRIHDFIMNIGPYAKRFNAAACVVATPEFVNVKENPAPGVRLAVQVGYPFIDFAPVKSYFGFGPGKFGIAAKQYSFELMDDNSLRSRMEFAAAPRCRKVFDFGRRWPDPIYGGAALLGRLSLGAWDPEIVHTVMDTEMLAQHCRVHQSLMDGLAHVWQQMLDQPVGRV